MMKEERRTIECEALVQGGALLLPENVRQELSSWKRRYVRLRIVDRPLAAALSEKKVTDDEVDAIAAVQSEQRVQVLRFLMSEGALRRPAARRRKR
jgi:hypothetical protein